MPSATKKTKARRREGVISSGKFKDMIKDQCAHAKCGKVRENDSAKKNYGAENTSQKQSENDCDDDENESE
jgi:hypothetical protein